MDLPTAMVFDIDGVLADVRHRLHHVQRRPKDWNAFFAAAPADPLLAPGAQLVDSAARDGHTIVYLTGRPERCRRDTEDWLARHGLAAGAVHMRRDTDRRPARLTKVETLRQLSWRHRIEAFIDDDAAVVEQVRAAGFQVLHATWMTSDTASADAAPPEVTTALLREIQEDEGRT